MRRIIIGLVLFLLMTITGFYIVNKNLTIINIKLLTEYHQCDNIILTTVTPTSTIKPIPTKIPFTPTPKDNTKYYDIPLNKDLQKYIYKKCKETGFTYETVLAMIKLESNYNPKAINKNTNGTVDKGLCQINSSWNKELKKIGITDLFDPYQNIDAAFYILQNDCNHDNEHKMLMCYNMGSPNTKRLNNRGIYSSKYSRKVIDLKQELLEGR